MTLQAKYISEGETINYTAGGTIARGEVILLSGASAGAFHGVATTDLVSGQVGALLTDGVVEVPKLSADTMNQGETVYWDNTNNRVTTTASTHKKFGVAIENKSSGETTCRVAISKFINL